MESVVVNDRQKPIQFCEQSSRACASVTIHQLISVEILRLAAEYGDNLGKL